GKLVQELPEFRVPAGEGVQGLEAVDDDQPGPTVSHDGGDPLAHAGQPVPAGDLAQILVENRLADRGGLEELQGLPEADDLLQRLGQGGEVDGGAVRGGVVERVMLGEDRLAGARQPHDHRDAVVRQAAAEDLVQGPVAAAEPAVVHQRSCPASMALDRSRSRTVDTSWSGSSGLRRNASAPASIGASMTSTADTATIATSACDRHRRTSRGECLSGDAVGRRHLDVEPLGLEEELLEFSGVDIGLGELDQQPGGGPDWWCGQRLAHFVPLGEQPVRIRHGGTLAHLRADEPQLFYLTPAVQPVAVGVPRRYHLPVPVLPGPQRGNRNTNHPGHRADAIDRTVASGRRHLQLLVRTYSKYCQCRGGSLAC